MDSIDEAQQRDEQLREAALAAHLALRSRKLTQVPESLTECLNCGDDIPAARQAAVPGVKLCQPCQTMFEGICW